TDLDAWNRVQAVNATGVFLCCKHGIPHLLDRGGGSVINVASFVALMGAATSQIAYTASKGAVLSMSRELAVEFARRGVRVNALCPGPVETPLLMRLFGDDPAAYERRRVHLPMGRLAQAREIAAAALSAASAPRTASIRAPGARGPSSTTRGGGNLTGASQSATAIIFATPSKNETSRLPYIQIRPFGAMPFGSPKSSRIWRLVSPKRT